MLAATKLHWLDVSDVKYRYYKDMKLMKPWPRMNRSAEQWESDLKTIMFANIWDFWILCANKLDSPLDDPKDTGKIFRFVLMPVTFITTVKNFLSNLGYVFILSAKEIHDGLIIPRAVVEEGKSRVKYSKEIWLDVLGRAAVKIGAYGQFSRNQQINDWIAHYVNKHGGKVHHGIALTLNKPRIHDYREADPYKYNVIKFTCDNVMQCNWRPGERGSLFVCPPILWVMIGCVLTKPSSNTFIENNRDSPKTGTMKCDVAKKNKILFSYEEYEQVMKRDVDTGASNDVIHMLYTMFDELVCFCYPCVIFVFVFVFFFFILA